MLQSRMADFSRYALPAEPLTDDSEKNNIEPVLPGDSGKLCMYVAMAGASGLPGGRDSLIALTKPLRTLFQVPYDDDVWALILGYLFDFRFFKQYGARRECQEGIAADAKNGDNYYISIMAKSSTASGHALYAEKSGGTLRYVDNENLDTTEIASKFSNNNFLVFKCSEKSASGGVNKLLLNTKVAQMPSTMVATLSHARSQYSEVKVDDAPYSALDIPVKFGKTKEKVETHVTSHKDFDYSLYALWIKAIKAWDEAMPKQ